jgi:response regulator RpfG family c-di-GMP phosphodiesterase
MEVHLKTIKKHDVLLIQSDQAAREELTYQLQKLSLRVIAAESISQAFGILYCNKLDIVILENYDREQCGSDLIEEIKASRPGISVLTIAYRNYRDIPAAMKEQVDRVLVKSVLNRLYPPSKTKKRSFDRFDASQAAFWDHSHELKFLCGTITNISLLGVLF